MATMTKKSTQEIDFEKPAVKAALRRGVKIEGPVVDKKGKPTEATKVMLTGLTTKRSRAKKIVVVEATKPKNPIQIRHQRADLQPAGKYALNGVDTVTDCGRIVVKQMTRKDLGNLTGKTVVACPHCLVGGHRDRAFQIVRGAVKLLPVEA
jgi:hypothetical protein